MEENEVATVVENRLEQHQSKKTTTMMNEMMTTIYIMNQNTCTELTFC